MKRLLAASLTVIILGIGLAVWFSAQGRQSPPSQDQVSSGESDKKYSLYEVAVHKTKDDCWTIISGTIYDVTPYVTRHPGGNEIVNACGKDATSLFLERRTSEGVAVGSGSPHSVAAQQQLAGLKIGTLIKP